MVFERTLTVATKGRGLYDVTAEVRAVVAASKVTTGMCSVFVAHTSASLVIQENADPAVLRDLERWMARVAPEIAPGAAHAYEHDAEGVDDMPAHLRSAITKTSETLPIRARALALGTWQALYLWEHRAARHERRLLVTIVGE